MSGLSSALSLFSVIPAKSGELSKAAAVGAIRWLPVVGAVIGVLSAAVLAALQALGAPDPLAAVAAIAVGAALTGGLHLDGLADTADGLGSRRPPELALDIMRRPDVGPMGVVTLTLTLLAQVAALQRPLCLAVALAAIAPLVGRVACVMACAPHLPSARPEGLGALFQGAASRPVRLWWALAMCVVAAAGGYWAGGVGAAGGLVGAALVALVTSQIAARWVSKRLGGLTGDVMGALMEGSATVFLLVGTVSAAWF